MDFIPQEFSRFDCQEYFRNFRAGKYDAHAHIWLILPAEQIGVASELDALIVGQPGVDGIKFCYRLNLTGIWAFYPMDDRWVAVASTLEDLLNRWNDGSLRV